MTLAIALLDAESRAFFDRVGGLLATPHQQLSFARYGVGLLSTIDRKSMEPIAALFCEGTPERCNGMHQSIHRFISEAEWDDAGVRAEGSDFAIEAMTAQAPLEVAIIDDSGLVKAGNESVGVARQYCGRLGKIENCQVVVALAVANGRDAVTIDMELYLSQDWTSDLARRKKAKIPRDVEFRTKPQLALIMLELAASRGIKPPVVVADSDYGKDPKFRDGIRQLGQHFAVGVHSDQPVRRLDKNGRATGTVTTASAIAHSIRQDKYGDVVWREGTKGKLHGRFALVPVLAVEEKSHRKQEPLSLLIEWAEDAAKPEHFTLISFDTSSMTFEEVVRIVKERWRIERCFQEQKSELGLAHFEGRSWCGLNHHLSAVVACHAFAVGIRARVSPPDPTELPTTGTLGHEAREARCPVLRDHPPRSGATAETVGPRHRAA